MRSMLWTAVLTAVLLAPGCGGDRAQVESPPSGDPSDDSVLAKVGDREIRVRDLLHKIKVQLPAMGDSQGLQDVRQKRQVLSQMVDQYCWVFLAEENNWDQDPEMLSVLELSRKYIVANHSAEKAVYSKAHPTGEEIEAYYVENADEFRVAPTCKASQIVVSTEAEAQQIYRLLQQGSEFAKLATERSIDRTARSGGLLGTIAAGLDVKGHTGRPDLSSMILALGDNEFSVPVQVTDGWAIFYAYEHAPERARALDEVAGAIEELLNKKRANELFAETLARVREDAGVTVFSTAFIEYAVRRLSDVETLAMANLEPDPVPKIAYYEGLIREHPSSPIAPQAQFMVGFIKADELEDFAGAKPAFEEMIRLYPDDDLVDSARWMLANMDKDLEGDSQLEKIRLQAHQKRKTR
jgi:hypothetical protein